MKKITLFFVTAIVFIYVTSVPIFCQEIKKTSKSVTISESKEEINPSRVDSYIENNFNRYDKRLDQFDKSIDRTYTIIGYAMTGIAIIIALLTWVGFQTMRKWIKQIVQEKTAEEHEVNTNKLRAVFDGMIKEMEEKAKSTFKSIESTRAEYLETLEQLKSSQVGEEPTISPSDSEKLNKFVKDLDVIKSEAEFTNEDWYYKAMSNIDNKQFEKAADFLRRSIAIKPDNYAYANLAYCLKNLNKFTEAIEIANKAIEIDNNDSYSFELKAECFMALGDLDNAISGYEAAYNINKKKHSTRLCLVELYLLKGNYVAATEWLSFQTKKYSLVHKFITAILNKINNINNSAEEAELNDLIALGRCKTDWSFDEIKKLLEKPEVGDDVKEYISRIVEAIENCNK